MSHRLPLALIALIITISVGCKEPVGLPDDTAHAAATYTIYCTVAADTALTGYVSVWSGLMTIDSAHQAYFDKIRRGYYEEDDRWYPRMNGFCTFEVPHFDTRVTPACTLIYYQSAHNGSADLLVDWLYGIGSAPYDYDAVFWAAWDDHDLGCPRFDGQWKWV